MFSYKQSFSSKKPVLPLNLQVKKPMQLASPQLLAGAEVAAPAVGLVEMDVPMCLSAVLVCLACVSMRLP